MDPAPRHDPPVSPPARARPGAQVRAVLGVVEQVRRLEQGLGRDAPDVQARPSEVSPLALLYERHLHPELACPDRGYVPRVSTTDYYEIELLRHLYSPFRS